MDPVDPDFIEYLSSPEGKWMFEHRLSLFADIPWPCVFFVFGEERPTRVLSIAYRAINRDE